MNQTLKKLSLELCKPVLAGLKTTPKNHIFANTYGKGSLITAMYHVMGFDGEKLERVPTVNEEALRKYCFLLIRPFFHNLNVTVYVNTGKQWELFGKTTRSDIVFEPGFRAAVFKVVKNLGAWRATIESTGIANLKPPTTDVLPTLTGIIRKFGDLAQHGLIGPFTLGILDGMSRASDVNTYVRALMSVMHFEPKISDGDIRLETSIEGSTISIQIAEFSGTPPVPRKLGNNGKISESLKTIRSNSSDKYGDFFDIVMLRALKNTIAVVPIEGYDPHAISFHLDDMCSTMDLASIDAYMVSKDNRSHIRIYATIEVNK